MFSDLTLTAQIAPHEGIKMTTANARVMRLAEAFRIIAARGQYGHSRKPANFYVCADYCSYHWSGATHIVTYDQWQKLADLAVRYHRFLHYMREIQPQWVVVERINYADNSIEAVQRSQLTGNTRRVMEKAPSGDACY